MMSDFTSEQLTAITTIDNNVSVSAGAGSGKTKVLVERFLHILEQGHIKGKPVSPREILAITFTRKAAGEMKERVRIRITEKLAGAGDKFWKQVLDELERAQITTIHGFCSRLLKENPVELGLDPSFNLAEEFEGEEYLQECLLDFVRQGLKQQRPELSFLTNTYGVNSTISQLQSLLPQLEDIIAFGDLTKAYNDRINAEPAGKARLCSLIEELANCDGLGKTKTATAVALLKENLTEVTEGILQEPSDFTAYNNYVGSIKNPAKAVKDLVVAIKELQQSLLDLSVDRAALPLVTAWQKVVQDFADYYRARKKQDDFLTFDDLEELALKLLLENEQVRHRCQQKYRYLMVDEFQDTNDRQKQIIYLLCGDDVNKLQGRKLFVVGDPKQSIYRFRGADVSVFAQVRKDIEKLGGKNISLSKNFRTKESIVETCNYVFSKLLGEDCSKDIFFERVDIGEKERQTGGVKPVLLEVPYDNDTKPFARQMEAAAVANYIKELRTKGTPYGKMAILLSAMTVCNIVTEALENFDIPYQVVDGKGFYERQEVLDFLHLLTVLQNRQRSLELAGVLRSPYFGVNDEVITKMFLLANQNERCLWDTLMGFDVASLEEEQQAQVQYAQAVLEELRKNAALLALPELLQKIMQVLNLEAVLSLQDNGVVKLANVKKLINLAQEFCVVKQGTLASWLARVHDFREAQVRETAANLPVTDAVTIMTIHKSKGLEFDTVFLPMLDRKGGSDWSVIKFHKQLGLGVKAALDNGDVEESSVLKQIKEEDKNLEKAEKQRQLYVAMTRAEQSLVLSGIYKADGKSTSENWFNDLRGILEKDIHVIKPEYDYEELLKIKGTSVETNVIPQAELLAPLESYGASGKNYFSPSALQTYLHCQRQYFYQQEGMPALEVEGEGISSDLPPHVVGSLIHKALELYNGKELDKAFSQAAEEFAPGNVSGTAKAKQMLENYVASELYKALPKKKLKELRFNLPVGELLINGIIDCVVETDDGLMLVDYKTGRPPAENEVHLGYAYQLAIYKYAVEKLLGKKAETAKLHFLQNLSQWNLPEGKDYLDEALALCKEIGSKGEEKDFACNLANCKYCPYNYLCPQK
ncbi:MAG: UvrD-helicase domain-containing protein [Phascolarctobacterium sp.]|nr:UvrD-helicase domain-containing protein [Phascolarctobacterium sp.]